jgi:hypothetical protein
MRRALLGLAVTSGLVACGDGGAPVDAAVIDASGDAGAIDAGLDATAVDCDGGCAGVGEACGSSDVDLDAGARTCATGLVCCYPCGVANCVDRCIEPCSPAGPGCQANGCPGPFP